MTAHNFASRYCIIGGGAAGITAAKNLLQQSIPIDLIEQEDDFGGQWYYGKPCSALYKSVHMISSKEFSVYTDYPAPSDWQTYLRADQGLEYLRNYARHFDIYRYAEFGRSVIEITPAQGGNDWIVKLDGGEVRRYQGVVVANGHLSKPALPDLPGRFNGLQMHSAQYKTPDVLKDRRVLVLGGGNSGCDIAVEAAHHGAASFHSTRRGYYYWPKFVFGMPVDAWAEWSLRMRVPLWARRWFGKIALDWSSAGSAEKYGLPKPDHKLLESHFTINSTLLYHIGHGDITPKPGVKELRGDEVVFDDDSVERIDVIIYATGFELSFPFIEQKYLSWPKTRPELYMSIFDPQHKSLFFVGLFQTSTGNWPMMDYQAQLVSRYLNARAVAPSKAARLDALIAKDKTNAGGGIRYVDTPRHAIEFEHFAYRLKIRRLINRLPTAAPLAVQAPLRPAVLSS